MSRSQTPSRPRTRWRDVEACVPILKEAAISVLSDDEEAYLRAVGRTGSVDSGSFNFLALFIALTLPQSLMNANGTSHEMFVSGIRGWQTFLTPRIDDSVLAALVRRAARLEPVDAPWPRIDRIEFLDRYMATCTLVIAFCLHENPWQYERPYDAYADVVKIARREFRLLSFRRYFDVRSGDLRGP